MSKPDCNSDDPETLMNELHEKWPEAQLMVDVQEILDSVNGVLVNGNKMVNVPRGEWKQKMEKARMRCSIIANLTTTSTRTTELTTFLTDVEKELDDIEKKLNTP